MRRRALSALLLVLAACKSDPSPPAAASAPAPRTSLVPSASVAALPSPSASAAEEPKLSGVALVENAALEKLASEPGGRLVAELHRTPPARAIVVLATQSAPLLPRETAAYFRIAELVAPGLAAPTALRVMTAADLAKAADEPTRQKLEKQARVLANGTVEVALVLAPAPNLKKIEIANSIEGEPVYQWEMKLAQREAPPEADQITLSRYQSLLAADYVAQNLSRKHVYLLPKSGRITVADENEAFSTQPKDGAVNDGYARLMRHVTFGKKLRESLAAFSRETAEKTLRWGDPPTLLVTPKQLDESVDRAKSVLRVIDQRVKQHGEAATLVLP